MPAEIPRRNDKYDPHFRRRIEKKPYGAVSYYRADYGDGRVDVTFIVSKTRV